MADRKTARTQFKKVVAVAPAQLKLIRYVDGTGKDEVRLAVKAGDRHYLLREKVGTDMLLQPCLDWVEEGIHSFRQGGDVPEPHDGLSTEAPIKGKKKKS
jgi:hypothetical protein